MEGLLDLGFGFVEIGKSPLCYSTVCNKPTSLLGSVLLTPLHIAYTSTELSSAVLMLDHARCREHDVADTAASCRICHALASAWE